MVKAIESYDEFKALVRLLLTEYKNKLIPRSTVTSPLLSTSGQLGVDHAK
jgi:hypothetical protein